MKSEWTKRIRPNIRKLDRLLPLVEVVPDLPCMYFLPHEALQIASGTVVNLGTHGFNVIDFVSKILYSVLVVLDHVVRRAHPIEYLELAWLDKHALRRSQIVLVVILGELILEG